MDGDTGKLHGIRNVTYKLENERGTFAGIRFNRNKSKCLEKKRQNVIKETQESTSIITTSTDLVHVYPKIVSKSSTESKEYTKCALCKECIRKMSISSIGLKPFKNMLSSYSFMRKSKIKEISISPDKTLANNFVTRGFNVNRRVNNEVEVLYERDITQKEDNDKNIPSRRSVAKNVNTKKISQISLFGFQRCIQRKRHLNYNLNVFYKFLQNDGKRHNVLRCKHYSFEDFNPDKPKKKSSFVKCQSDIPARYNLIKFTQRSSVSNVYLLKPKDCKITDSLRKNKIPCCSSDLDKRKSILKTGDCFDNVNTKKLKIKCKEKKVATKDCLTSRPISCGATVQSEKCSQVKPKICNSCKRFKKSAKLFNFLNTIIKYFLIVMSLIVWLPCILALVLVWLISYLLRPNKEACNSKCVTKKKRRKSTNKPHQCTRKEKKCSKCENKKKHNILFKKKQETPCKSKKKKVEDRKCVKKCSKCTQYTTKTTGFRSNEEIGLCMGKKRQKSVSFKQPCGKTSETYIKVSKNKDGICSGCWQRKDRTQESVDICVNKNQAKQNLKQKSPLHDECQKIVIKSCQGKLNRRKIEVCVPKSLSKILQTALRGTCSTTNEFTNICKLPKIKSCNNPDTSECIKSKKKRKCANRRSSNIRHTLKKNIEVSTTTVTNCLPSPCPGGYAITEAKNQAKIANEQAAGGDNKKCNKTCNRKKAKCRKITSVMKFLPPPPCKTCNVSSNICVPLCTSKTKLLPFLPRYDRTARNIKPLKVVSGNKSYPPICPDVCMTSSNTVMPKTSSFMKFFPTPFSKIRNIASNTCSTQVKPNTVVKFFPASHKRLIHSAVNTIKPKPPPYTIKSKSTAVSLSAPTKILKYYPKARSRTIASTCIIDLPLRKQTIKPKCSKCTSLPQRKLFCSLSATTATNTCSTGPTHIIKFIKSRKSLINRGTVSKSSGPILKIIPRRTLTRTRGVNPRKEEWCFVSGFRKFQEKRKKRKLCKISNMPQPKILIPKKAHVSPKTSSSRSSTHSPTPSCSRSALQAKERAKQRAERAKQQAKEKAKGKSMDIALARQKARNRATAQKARGKKCGKSKSKTQKKKRKKARKRMTKKGFRRNAGKVIKKLTIPSYNIPCQELLSGSHKPCKIIYDRWPSAYPAFLVLYKMYNNVCHIFFFFLACCIWSPLFCWCFVFYFLVIKRMFC